MGDRAVYCARLESVCAERHRGFESPPIRSPSNREVTLLQRFPAFSPVVHAKESLIGLRKAWMAVITFLVPDFYCAAFVVIHFAYQSRQRL